jgi:hypothetical protein
MIANPPHEHITAAPDFAHAPKNKTASPLGESLNLAGIISGNPAGHRILLDANSGADVSFENNLAEPIRLHSLQ